MFIILFDIFSINESSHTVRLSRFPYSLAKQNDNCIYLKKHHSWGLIALIWGATELQMLCYVKEIKFSDYDLEITTLSFVPSLVKIC